MQKLFLFYVLSIFLYAEHNYSNALAKEHSPYLQQHVYNPVHWYPWGEEALEKAKKENKLIFLSIGYSTCHWCHVMEEESFTDVDIAKVLNEDFVSIKVDREEYPQIDKKYQALYMQVHGERGGWPLSVFMSPEKEVFFLGTYIPKEAGYGSKGLEVLLPSFVRLQKENKLFNEMLARHAKISPQKALNEKKNTKILERIVLDIAKEYDTKNGGFSSRPKFPEASKIELLLDIYKLNGNKQALKMALHTLTQMARGGIYDQIGGGFFRYTTDYQWQLPHFEKMLYTNGELIAVYAKAYLMTGDRLYKKVVDESIAQMEKNYSKEGVYFAASDADSNGEEGGYFIYEYIEVKAALKERGWKPSEIEDALAYMGIEEDGNIDGDLSHTHIVGNVIPKRIDELKKYLKDVSAKRPFPFIDKKIITAWNAMMIKALFVASKIDDSYLPLAQKRLETLLLLMQKESVLYHQTLLGKGVKQKALLEDYAFLVDALILAYERTYDTRYLKEAEALTLDAVKQFYRDNSHTKTKRWYLSNDGIETYADFDDRYYTSALSVMLENLLRLSTLTEKTHYGKIARESIEKNGAVLHENIAAASKLAHAYIRLKKGDIVIHAKKDKLLLVNSKLDSIAYPFILSAVQESDEYLACKTTMCFAYDKNITKLIQKINEAVE